MDAFHLREILLKIGKEVRCPMCSSSIPPQNIKLLAPEADSECIMQMTCPNCYFDFGGKAKMIQMISPEGKKFNASSLVKLDKKHSETISMEEKKLLQAKLMQARGITEFLQ